MPVQRLGHVNVRTPLLEETVAFYERALGLKRGEAKTVSDQVNFVWLYDDAGIAVVHVNRPPEGEPPRAIAPGRLDHFAFECADPNGFAQRLRDADVPFQAVRTPQGGLIQYILHDPNGLKIELTFPA